MNSLLLRPVADPESTPVEPTTNNDDLHIVDLHKYMPLGGVYYFDLFRLPPQSFTINDWQMTEVRILEITPSNP